MNPAALAAAMQIAPELAELWAEPLTTAMAAYAIDTPARQAAFLATIGHESHGLSRLEENLSYSAERLMQIWPARFPTRALAERYAGRPEELANAVYAGRLGNVQPGDGWRFRGRGPIQLTGLRNYRAFGASLPIPIDLERDPDLVRDDPLHGAASAGWYFERAGCNERADTGDFDGVCDLVNRGAKTDAEGDAIGYKDRVRRWRIAKEALGVQRPW